MMVPAMILALFLTVLSLSSCSNEDDLAPSNSRDNWFEVAEDDNTPEAVLRRNFYKETGIFLLFNDTLRHVYQGKDAYGRDAYFTELVDFGYSVTNYNDYYYHIESYNTLEEKESATQFVRDLILPHIQGGKMAPFSLMLTREILYDYYGDEESAEPVASLTGKRCMALALGDVVSMDAEEKVEAAGDFLFEMVSTAVNALTWDDMAPFYDISENYAGMYLYGEYFEDLFDDFDPDNWTKAEATEIANKYGFLSYSVWWYPYFPYNNNDVKDYLNAVWNYTPEEFEELYSDYPIIIEKYNWMRNLIINMGYKF